MKNHASVVAIAGERDAGKTTLVNGLIALAVFRESDGSRANDDGRRAMDASEVRRRAVTVTRVMRAR